MNAIEMNAVARDDGVTVAISDACLPEIKALLNERVSRRILLAFLAASLLHGCGPEPDIPANADYGKGEDIKVIKFYADWCQPCQAMKPEYEKVKMLYPHVQFYEVDLDKNMERVKQFDIQGTPYVIKMRNRSKIKRRPGYMSRNDLVRFIEND